MDIRGVNWSHMKSYPAYSPQLGVWPGTQLIRGWVIYDDSRNPLIRDIKRSSCVNRVYVNNIQRMVVFFVAAVGTGKDVFVSSVGRFNVISKIIYLLLFLIKWNITISLLLSHPGLQQCCWASGQLLGSLVPRVPRPHTIRPCAASAWSPPVHLPRKSAATRGGILGTRCRSHCSHQEGLCGRTGELI